VTTTTDRERARQDEKDARIIHAIWRDPALGIHDWRRLCKQLPLFFHVRGYRDKDVKSVTCTMCLAIISEAREMP
jgi:hypothetical protein